MSRVLSDISVQRDKIFPVTYMPLCLMYLILVYINLKVKNALLCILDIDLFPDNSMIESTQRLLRNFLCNK